jgi:hypothetical protein
MDKKHWKRGKEASTRSPTLIYMTSCREVKGREIIRERDQERNIRSMKTGGDIPTGGVTIFPMMSKGEKEKYQKRSMKHEDRGRNPKGRYPFPLMSKGERNIGREDEERWSQGEGEYECFHQFQRGRLLDSWLSLMSTLVNP